MKTSLIISSSILFACISYSVSAQSTSSKDNVNQFTDRPGSRVDDSNKTRESVRRKIEPGKADDVNQFVDRPGKSLGDDRKSRSEVKAETRKAGSEGKLRQNTEVKPAR